MMIEGWKAYVLPGSAAVLLAVFFAWRCSVDDGATPSTDAERKAAPASPREQIEAAVAAEGSAAPPLPDGYRESVRSALDPIVARCREQRNSQASLPLAIRIEVAAAENVGGIVRTIEVSGAKGSSPSRSLATCIEQGGRALALPDAAATGIGTYDLEVAP